MRGKPNIDEHGVPLHGCECHECTKTNRECPKCGCKYWNDDDRPDMEECPRCMWTPHGSNELAHQAHMAELASFDRSLKQIHADGVRLGVLAIAEAIR